MGWFYLLKIFIGIDGSHHEVITLAFIISVVGGGGGGRLESSMWEWLWLLLQEGRSGEGAGFIEEEGRIGVEEGEGGLTEAESKAAKS